MKLEPDLITLLLRGQTCVVSGCTNDVVRTLTHPRDARYRFGLCQFHGERAMRYMTEEQVNRYVFPTHGDQQ